MKFIEALRAGDGDHDAVTLPVGRTGSAICRVCAALVDEESADDLTQETYLRAARAS